MSKTYYEIIGVYPCATKLEIRDAYWDRARKMHPDMFPKASAEELFKITTKFTRLTTAYSVLSDAKARAKYDHLLALKMRPCNKCRATGVRYNIHNRPAPCAECLGRGYHDR
jgi:DnaJ-class molecular chaperone